MSTLTLLSAIMRITREAKAATSQRILESAAQLFRTAGWEETTTREIAAAAGIANGTLFNYFPCKEGIAAALLADALETAGRDFASRPRGEMSLEEDLFAFVWGGLKGLRPYREFLAPAAETIFSPLAQFSAEKTGDAIRIGQLEMVEQIVAEHGGTTPLPPVLLQLYWTLYLGVFAAWAADPSPNQEDTLPLLDQSLKLLVPSLLQRRSHDE
jgi:AcrR family transcriptional regulator